MHHWFILSYMHLMQNYVQLVISLSFWCASTQKIYWMWSPATSGSKSIKGNREVYIFGFSSCLLQCHPQVSEPIYMYLVPASAVEVIESVPSFCLCVCMCPSVSLRSQCQTVCVDPSWQKDFGAKELYNMGRGGASMLRHFHVYNRVFLPVFHGLSCLNRWTYGPDINLSSETVSNPMWQQIII